MEDDDDADAEAGENTRDYLEVALSQFWEALFRRRTTSVKKMKTSRDDEHEEDAVPWSRFEMLCEGGALGDASRPWLPPAAVGCRWVVVVVVVVVQRRFSAGHGEDDGDDGMGDTFVTTTTTTAYNDETCPIAVIGHGIVGKDIPIMARLAKARRWSK